MIGRILLIGLLLFSPVAALAGGHCTWLPKDTAYHDYGHQKVVLLFQSGYGVSVEAEVERRVKPLADKLDSQNQALNALRGDIAGLRTTLLKFQGSGTFQFGGQIAPTDDPQPNPQPVPPTPQPVPDDGPGPASEFTPAFKAVIASSCANCHHLTDPTAPRDKLNQLAITPENTDANRQAVIWARVSSDKPKDRMPPNGSTLEQRTAVEDWVLPGLRAAILENDSQLKGN